MTRGDFISSTTAASLVALHPFSVQATANQAHLRILETTDLHMHIHPYDYYADRPRDTVGLSRTAALIQTAREEAANSVLIDNGDFLQGNPMGDYIAYERGMKDGDMHPIISAMNTLGFDASTLGNHEFNYGLGFLMKSLAGASFPVISANVVKEMGADPTRDTTLVKPYVILQRHVTDGTGTRHPIKLGLIGFLPPQILTWDRRHLEGRVQTRDIIETARAYVPRMKEAGADLIIALSHSGIGSARHRDGMENASVPLAAIDGIDAILTGHSHLEFPGPHFKGFAAVDHVAGTIHGKPAVMGGSWGSHLGLIDLMLERDGGVWRIVTSASGLRPIAKRNEDRSVTALVESVKAVEQAIAREHDETLAYIRRPVGKTTAPLHSYFALVADDPSVQIVATAQKWYMEEMMKGTPHAGLPLLSAAAPFKTGGRGGPDYFTDVPIGDVAIKNVADLYLYPNTVRAVRVTGAEVKDWLERAASVFNQITPGQPDQLLLNPSVPSYNFDVIDGLRYQIDLSQPAKFAEDSGALIHPHANRIVNLTYQGRPVDPAEPFIIATNSYRAGGGGNFPGTGDTVVFEAPDTNRDVIVRCIVEQGTINPSANDTWSFLPLPGTSVLFDTGPRASAYVDALRGVTIEPAGDGPEGFARFRLSL